MLNTEQAIITSEMVLLTYVEVQRCKEGEIKDHLSSNIPGMSGTPESLMLPF